MGFDGSDVRGEICAGVAAVERRRCAGRARASRRAVRARLHRWPRREASAAQLLRCSSVKRHVGEEVGGGTMKSRGRRHHGAGSASQISGSGRTKARARQCWSGGALRRQADTLETWGASQRHPLRACGAAADRLPIWILDDGTTLAPVIRQPSCRRRFRGRGALWSAYHPAASTRGTANCVTKRQRPCVRWTMVIPSAAHRDHESPVTSLSCKVAQLRFTVDW